MPGRHAPRSWVSGAQDQFGAGAGRGPGGGGSRRAGRGRLRRGRPGSGRRARRPSGCRCGPHSDGTQVDAQPGGRFVDGLAVPQGGDEPVGEEGGQRGGGRRARTLRAARTAALRPGKSRDPSPARSRGWRSPLACGEGRGGRRGAGTFTACALAGARAAGRYSRHGWTARRGSSNRGSGTRGRGSWSFQTIRRRGA